MSAGPPGGPAPVGVRDIILCAQGDAEGPEDLYAEPPVDSSSWMHAMPGQPDMRTGPADLGREVRIERLDHDTTEVVMNACQPRGHYFFPVRQFGQVYTLVRPMPLAEQEQHPYRWDPDGVLDDALVFSRLIRDNGFSKQYAARITEYEDGQMQIMYLPYQEDAIIFRLRRDREYLTGPEAEEVAALLAAYWQIEDMPGRVRRAIWRMAYAPRLRFADLAVPILVSGLEALLKVGTRKLTRQFKRRGAALAKELGIEEADADFFGRMYEGRSDWIHGSPVALFPPLLPAGVEAGASGPEDRDEVMVLAEVARLQDVLRGAVRRCIEDDEFRATFTGDQAIRDRF